MGTESESIRDVQVHVFYGGFSGYHGIASVFLFYIFIFLVFYLFNFWIFSFFRILVFFAGISYLDRFSFAYFRVYKNWD